MGVRALVVAILLVVASHATAQEDASGSRARELFQAADAAADRGQIVEAIDGYRASLELAPRPNTAFNLGVVLLAAGRALECETLVRGLLAGDYGAPSESVRDRATDLETRAGRTVATIRVTIAGPAGTTLRLDGELVPDVSVGSAQSVRVDPGTHRLLARGPHGEIVERELELSAGATRDATLAVEALAVDPVAPLPPPIASHTIWEEPWLHISLGFALACGIAGLVVGLVIESQPPNDPVWGHADALGWP